MRIVLHLSNREIIYSIMYGSLVQSIEVLQKSKYGKGNKKKLSTIQRALRQAKPLFLSENKTDSKLISFRRVPTEEQVPKILEEFVSDFEKACPKGGVSAKNYSLFSITLLKIIKTLETGKKRGLLAAHAINKINHLFVNHPVIYNKRAIHDPLGLVFAITELALESEKGLGKPYEFDLTVPQQLAPFMQKYHMGSHNALLQILTELKKMPKFRLAVSIGKKHEEIIKKFLEEAICMLGMHDKISRAKNLLLNITLEDDDKIALKHYDMLKLCYSDKELRPHLAEMGKTMDKTSKRFANTILDEVSNLK